MPNTLRAGRARRAKKKEPFGSLAGVHDFGTVEFLAGLSPYGTLSTDWAGSMHHILRGSLFFIVRGNVFGSAGGTNVLVTILASVLDDDEHSINLLCFSSYLLYHRLGKMSSSNHNFIVIKIKAMMKIETLMKNSFIF
jgi:hypothetical protein